MSNFIACFNLMSKIIILFSEAFYRLAYNDIFIDYKSETK